MILGEQGNHHYLAAPLFLLHTEARSVPILQSRKLRLPLWQSPRRQGQGQLLRQCFAQREAGSTLRTFRKGGSASVHWEGVPFPRPFPARGRGRAPAGGGGAGDAAGAEGDRGPGGRADARTSERTGRAGGREEEATRRAGDVTLRREEDRGGPRE